MGEPGCRRRNTASAPALLPLLPTLIPQGGTMTAAEARAWADALLQDSGAGVFFGACNFYSYIAK